MCENCTAIDTKMADYRQLARGVTEKRALEAIDDLIAKLEVQKAFLNPKSEK